MLFEVGLLAPASTDLLGVESITLLAMRPDGYIGLRSDKHHLAALERYRALVHTRDTSSYPNESRMPVTS